MRLPIRALTGNLLWPTTGAPWAIYRAEITGPARPTRAQSEKLLHQQTSVLKALRGSPMIASLCPTLDPVTVVQRMCSGTAMATNEVWAEVADNTLEALADVAMTHRTHWLALPLQPPTGAGLASALAGVKSTVGGMFAGPAAPVPRALIDKYNQAAAAEVSRLGGGLTIRPARESEVIWWFAHCYRRGVDEPGLPDATEEPAVYGQRGGVFTALGEVIFDEGARTDLVDPSRTDDDPSALMDRIRAATRRRLAPIDSIRRRYLKVMTEYGESYQAFIAVAETPRAFRFPGSEWLARLDDFGFPIDWVTRMDIQSNETAKTKTKKRDRELTHQTGEWDSEVTGPPAELEDAQQDIAEQRQRFAASRTEVDVQASTVLCVWGVSPEEVEARAAAVRAVFGSNEYDMVRPIGAQQELFHAMLPGLAAPRCLTDYRQFFLAQDFAMAMPLVSHDLGDPTGALLGFALDGSGCRPVLYEPAYGPEQLKSGGSLAAIAELGAGKSVILKILMFIVLARLRGRVIVVDRTPQAEYIRFARACPGQVSVVPVTASPVVSMDPLRLFAGGTAKAYAQSFFNTLLDLPTSELPGIVMREAIGRTVDESADRSPSASALIDTLRRISKDRTDRESAAAAALLVRRLDNIAAEPLSAIVFDADLPILDLLTADALIFSTSSVPLPTREETADPHQVVRLPAAKLLGRAIHVLIAGIVDSVAFKDERFTAFVSDECYSFTGAADGEAFALRLIRDGRKHNAAIYMAGHDVDDLGSHTIQGLISVRIVGRHRDPDLARPALRWLGVDPADEGMVQLVTGDLSPLLDDPAERDRRAGEVLLRDARNRVGKVKVLIPPYRDVGEAILTDPTSQAGAA